MSDRFHAQLTEEMAAWVRDGVITEEQRGAITARYEGRVAPSRFVGIMSLAGGALVTAGLALVIAHNWERLTDWTKIAGLIALMSCAYFGGFELKTRGYGRTGESFLMIGAGLFLCGIALVGQIYHLNARPPNAVLLWVVAVLPIAYLLQSAPVLLLGLAGFLIWIGWEFNMDDSLLYLGIGRAHDWGWDDRYAGFGMQEVGVAIGAALTAAGLMHRGVLAGFQRVFESIGLLVTGFSLYALGFTRRYWEGPGSPGFDELPAAPVILWALLAAVLILLSARHLPPEPRRPRRMMTAGSLLAVALSAAPPVLGKLGYAGTDTLLTLTLVYWILLFAVSLLWVSCAVRWRKPGWISIGLMFIGLTIITRYFDLLGSRLDQGLFYILGGVLLLSLALILERQRRRLLGRVAARSGA